MMSTVAEIEAAIELLNPEEIEELATWLDQRRPSSGFDPAIEEAWSVEIQRRIAEVESGRAKFIPAEQVMDELRKIADR